VRASKKEALDALGTPVTTTNAALGVFYAYLTSILVLPLAIVVWDRIENPSNMLSRIS